MFGRLCHRFSSRRANFAWRSRNRDRLVARLAWRSTDVLCVLRVFVGSGRCLPPSPEQTSLTELDLVASTVRSLTNKSEESLQEAMDGVFEHVGLPPSPVEDKAPKNRRDYPPMDPAVCRRLRGFYAPYDDALRRLLKRDSLPWSPATVAGEDSAAGAGWAELLLPEAKQA